MSKTLSALTLAATLLLGSTAALADVAGAPAGGTGGTTATSSGGGGDGGSKDKGGCATTPGGATTSAAMLFGLGILVAIPALRRRREKKGEPSRG